MTGKFPRHLSNSSDCHLLRCVRFIASSRSTDTTRTGSLLLEYLPELQALISSYEIGMLVSSHLEEKAT